MSNQADPDLIRELLPGADAGKDPERVAAGHKAALANPRTSEKAREHSKEVLSGMLEPYEDPVRDEEPQASPTGKDPANIARGLKASISNPAVSKEAKENAKEKLRQGNY
ncbi:Conidiation-specific protein 6 [Ophiocordyceps camponoti-floridani]|uniref:Conidiation-specific protein 6 n=1 Tax=Ophiocordyceps camponoti-floridani TaxID=2030778 RepID=A0A8H4Q3E2_9HYPO|nr:Conidiation-specific protein 6 [Ophiocordyceps camponoti-floridani]